MTFAMIHQVVITGLLFAVTMMMGVVALTFSVVAILPVVLRKRISYLTRTRPRLLASISRTTGGIGGRYS